jgi:chaperonin GroES
MATATQTKVRPLNEKVLIKRAEAQTQTKSGLYLPESAAEKPQEAEVIAVGDGKLLESGERAQFQVKPGDRVLISKWGGTEIKIDEVDYLILNEEDILAVIEG